MKEEIREDSDLELVSEGRNNIPIVSFIDEPADTKIQADSQLLRIGSPITVANDSELVNGNEVVHVSHTVEEAAKSMDQRADGNYSVCFVDANAFATSVSVPPQKSVRSEW